MKALVKLTLCLSLILLLSVMSNADIADKFTTVKLWDARTGKELIATTSQIEHKSDVYTLAFSPDGKILASGGRDNAIKLSNSDTGKGIETLGGQIGHTGAVRAVVFSHNGKLLASASDDHTIKLWEISSQKEPLTIVTLQNVVTSVAFSHDDKFIAGGGTDKTIRLWSVETGKEIGQPLIGHEAAVNSIAFSQDDKRLVSGSNDQSVRIWDVNSRTLIRSMVKHTGGVTSIAFSPDGKTIASGSDDDTIKLWDAGLIDENPRTLRGHHGPVTSVAFNYDGSIIASGSWDATVKFWKVQTGKEEKTLAAHSYRVTSVAFSPDKARFASSTIAPTETPPPGLFIIAVGQKDYGAPLSPVNYADLDALEFTSLIEQGGKNVFQRINKQVLLNSEASLTNIKAVMESVKTQIKPQDTIIFYFAGHSKISSRQVAHPDCYLLSYNISNPESEEALFRESLSASYLKEWLQELSSQRQLVILNCMEQADIFSVFVAHIVGENNELAQLTPRDLVILGADGVTPESNQRGVVNHSPFTSALLQGMAEEKGDGSGEVRITARKLESYLFRNLSKLSNEQIARAKHIGNDFPLISNHTAAAQKRGNGEAKSKPVRPGKYYALLVAGEDYNDKEKWARLTNPPNDADAIADALVRIYGFEPPEIIHSPTFTELYNVLLRYKEKKKFEENDVLLIFFAGHGDYDEDTEEGCIVAKDSKWDATAKEGYLRYSVLRVLADKIPCKHILIVLDVCFGGTFNQQLARSAILFPDPDEASVDEFVQRKMRFKTREFLASTGKAYASDGNPGEPHSPFASKFLEALESYGSPWGVLTLGRIKEFVDILKNQPFVGTFGSHNPQSEFILIVK